MDLTCWMKSREALSELALQLAAGAGAAAALLRALADRDATGDGAIAPPISPEGAAIVGSASVYLAR